MARKKKNSAARFAFIGWIVAGLGAVATFLLAVVKGAVALQLYTPAKPEQLNLWLSISAAVLVVGLAVYAILAPDRVRRFFSGRQARYGSNALILSVAFIGILVVANVLAFQNPKSWDLTEDKQHTLSPESVQTLSQLPQKVTALAFYSPQTSADAARTLLNNFKSNSNGKFDFRFVDPSANPVLAQKYNITSDGKVVLTMGNASETASFTSENEITNALVRLISPETRVVYFLTGHGEPDTNGNGNDALSRARSTLESKNYTVQTLNLAAENKIPDDAKAIVIVGPTSPLLDQEVTLLKSYVDKGGSLVVMDDPTPFTKVDSSADPLADYLKTDWGITLDNDVVIDLTSNQPLNAISASYNSSQAITQHMTTVSIMPQARSLTISDSPPSGVTPSELIQTSSQSWGETDFESLQGQVSFDQNADIAGPLTLAASAENSNTNGRVVVFGSSIFVTDQGFDAYANGDIFVNAVDWAARQDNLINITPRTPTTRVFNAPPQFQFILILLGSIIVIPGLIIGAGISTWVSRRRRG